YSHNPHVQPSAAPPIPLASRWAADYTPTADLPLLNLAQGVPGASPPRQVLDRLAEAAADPDTTKYGDLRGDIGLRRELVRDLNAVYGVKEGADPVGDEEVALTAGCNLAFYATMLALAQSGDQVILPTPWYFNNEMVLRQLGIDLVPLACPPPSFLPSVELARSLVTDKTKAIVLVSPNNPTGAVYPDSLLREFADLTRDKKIALVLDETYREFVDGRPHGLFAETEWREYLIHLFSFSKSFAIPGHRLGALICSRPFLAQISKLLDCLQICPARPAQRVVEWAIEGTREWRSDVRRELEERQRRFRVLLKDVEGWEVTTGAGYFAYVKHPYTNVRSEVVSARLARHVGIVTLPGSFFSPPFDNPNDDRFIRFSIANVSIDVLEQVPPRLGRLNEMWSTFDTTCT
ncbi:hypothetical protein JCM10212_004374, partial [Sporobolomyces blumeae]